MGVYDEVVFEIPLPGDCKSKVFQTKDFDPTGYQNTYIITKSRTLWKFDGRTGEKAPYDYSGPMDFYDLDEAGTWWRFEAYFKDGHLQKLELIEHRVRDDNGGEQNEQ